MNLEALKNESAKAALAYIKEDGIIGVGSGSTVNYFIDALASIKHKIEGAVASSEASAQRLKAVGIPLWDLNSVSELPVYVDGTDEVNAHLQLIKGAGAALTREKIVAAVAKKFICIADASKKVEMLGKAPIAVEVIPMARSYVARELVKLGGFPVYRERCVTDNGNVILDVHNLNLIDPIHLEQQLNNIVGVVCHGLFAKRPADLLLLGTEQGIKIYP